MKDELKKAIEGLSEDHQAAIKKSVKEAANAKKEAVEAHEALSKSVKESIKALAGEKPDLKAALEPLAKSVKVDLPESLPEFQEKAAPAPEVPEELKEQWATLQKSQKAQAAEIEKLQKAAARKEYIEKAASFKAVPGASIDELGELLMKAHDAGHGEDLEKVLKAANAAMEKSGLFGELGSDLPDDTSDAQAKIEKAASELMQKSSEKMTKSQAIREVLRQNKELAREYRAAGAAQ